ncbi:HtaA domain-containing protein [Streptomyces sp. NPDC001443]
MTAAAPVASLRWAVKESFLRYVQVLAAGTCEATGEATLDADGVFAFPLIGSEHEAGNQVFAFGGGAKFYAHAGHLDVELHGLELWLTEEGGHLAVRGADQERIALATTGPLRPGQRDGIIPLLTDTGAAVFGHVYVPGTELAPLDLGALLD